VDKEDLVRVAVDRVGLSRKDAVALIESLFEHIRAKLAGGAGRAFSFLPAKAIKDRSKVWLLSQPGLKTPRNPKALTDAHSMLLDLIENFGSNAVARWIDVKPATVTNWKHKKRSMEAQYARRIMDLHYILGRAFQVFQPETAMRWLISNDPFLNEQQPLNVLVLEGPSRLIAALDAHETGAYP
jgi:uncharacterized protein (DUF2384 family)